MPLIVKFIMIILIVSSSASPSGACSCAWEGPFLKVAPKASLIICGKIIRHHPGPRPLMDVHVKDVISGGLLDSGLQLQMGDGMHCRPEMSQFPVGTEWIIAVNGPGAKPGSGFAVSHCGEYWLSVENGFVVGSIHGRQDDRNRMKITDLLSHLKPARVNKNFHGRINHGNRFQMDIGSGLLFVLEPKNDGWEILVIEKRRNENLARLTPPLHSIPNPREIEGWQFAGDIEACKERPYAAQAAPHNTRHFIFSPDVGKKVDGSSSKRAVTLEEIKDLERSGSGKLTVDRYELVKRKSECPYIKWMEFSVHIEGGF